MQMMEWFNVIIVVTVSKNTYCSDLGQKFKKYMNIFTSTKINENTSHAQKDRKVNKKKK